MKTKAMRKAEFVAQKLELLLDELEKGGVLQPRFFDTSPIIHRGIVSELQSEIRSLSADIALIHKYLRVEKIVAITETRLVKSKAS